jgi:hypothetical protein
MNDNQARFERLLHLGRGGAVLMLQQREVAPDRDLIRHACQHNLAYDRQCEGHRALFMFDIVQATGEPEFYLEETSRALLSGVGRREEDEESRSQMFDLLALFARNGWPQAGDTIAAAFAHDIAKGDTTGADTLVRLHGLRGFLHVAEMSGRHQHPEIEPDELDSSFWALEEVLGKTEARAALERTLTDRPDLGLLITPLLEREAERGRNRGSWTRPPAPSVEQLKGLLRGTVQPSRIQLMRWGRELDDPNAERFARDMLRETDPPHLARYVSLFENRRFPLDHTPLLDFARSDVRRLALAARTALTHIAHPTVRALALEILATPLPVEAVEMLIPNFREGDHALITAALTPERCADEIEWIGVGTFRFLEARPAPEAIPLLTRLYELGACTFCRERVLELLLTYGPLPAWIRDECRWDANEDVRRIAATGKPLEPDEVQSP